MRLWVPLLMGVVAIDFASFALDWGIGFFRKSGEA